ncbi:MAG: magnesium transporter CorA [Sulfobacillus thermosulfidooxidans]|uniref:Magnesium transporter CorA n=1 Tax=Sulfobacillus thermosulfidooxidans TaxID=28034 RepID=A0A2T2X672_SULTH|nr:MAG: magnesium transporter CorA [Sulfobacillus thermosulfidooxidans]
MPKYLAMIDEKTVEKHTWPEGETVLWVDLGRGEKDELQDIVNRLYRAHPVAVEKVLRGHERPSGFLIEEDAIVAVISDPTANVADKTRRPIGLFFGQRFLVTTHFHGDNGLIDTTWNKAMKENMLEQGLDFALYYLLYNHLRHFYQATRQIGQDFERLHVELLREPTKNLALKIVDLRKKTYWLYKVIRPEIKIFALLKEHIPYIKRDNRPYFEDLYSQIEEILTDVEAYRDGLEGMVEAFSGMQSNEINKVMKFFTIISVLALPATTIASIYGMNFWIPEIHWHYGYWYSLIVMFLVTVALLLYIKRNRWFR